MSLENEHEASDPIKTIERFLVNFPKALDEVRKLPDVSDAWFDYAYGVTPCLMVRYDKDDPKTERVRLTERGPDFELLAETLRLRQEVERLKEALVELESVIKDATDGLLIGAKALADAHGAPSVEMGTQSIVRHMRLRTKRALAEVEA